MPPFILETRPDAVLLRLNLEVTIQDAAALHAALVPALTGDRPLVLDASALTRVDTAVLQLLLAAARTAPQSRLAAPSDAWTAGLRRHALADAFPQP